MRRVVQGCALIVAVMFAGKAVVYACASCGSGGEDPLVLYPNERYKMYSGLSLANHYRNITYAGTPTAAGGPERKITWLNSVGASFGNRSFATLTLPVIRNERRQQTSQGFGDPIVATRYSLSLPLMTEPWRPQIQLLASYKHSVARSIHSSRDTHNNDVFGSGFSDIRAGVDLWNGNAAFKYGLAYTVSKPLPRRYEQGTIAPGTAQRGTMTVGWGWSPMDKTLVGINREARSAMRINKQQQARSKQLSHSLFVTHDYGISIAQSLRLSCSRQAWAGLPRSNTFTATTYSVAYLQAF